MVTTQADEIVTVQPPGVITPERDNMVHLNVSGRDLSVVLKAIDAKVVVTSTNPNRHLLPGVCMPEAVLSSICLRDIGRFLRADKTTWMYTPAISASFQRHLCSYAKSRP
jgi:hypothetical protein